ncbi:unnamed protein product [Staurois parvus]|uniref:C-type lectin domain-containing protein n=1 Tax=Staurois parvus TaxID=386267 RepID=A0ABN9GCS1_9NEOB|nr:unnamed protein product [Staurois parvus]
MCLNREAHLVIVNNEAEQNFLLDKYAKQFTWIGLTDVDTDGTFKWIDGTGLPYNYWGNGEPNGGTKENCVCLFREGKWNDYGCHINSNAICEKRLL